MRSRTSSFTVAPASPRCFRTSADGRIPLVADWPALWAAAERLPRVVVQTRHASARLVAIGPLPPLNLGRPGASARFGAGALQLHFPAWAQAWGRLEPCSCCGAPGRIEILNTAGAEFFQLCAAPECPPTDWSALLDPLAPASHCLAEPLPLTGGASLPLLSEDAEPLSGSPEALVPLLAGLADANVPLCCSLTTAEARHNRVFCPDYVAFNGGLLTAHDDEVTCQLALPSVVGLAVERTASGRLLHATGPGRTQLLSFSAAPGSAAASVWEATLALLAPKRP